MIYVGNDINDLPCFPLVGCAVALADAAARGASRRPTWCSARRGGHGAVRELCDLLLQTSWR